MTQTIPEIYLAPDGWDDRQVSFLCAECNTTVVTKSFFLDLYYLLEIGVTQAEFFRDLHMDTVHSA